LQSFSWIGVMPDFEISTLSVCELAAYTARVDRDGAAEVANLFAATMQAIGILQSRGCGPEMITVTIMGPYYEMEPLTMLEPVRRQQAITLLGAMVRQALELDAATPS
jgi:hypothetical protein